MGTFDELMQSGVDFSSLLKHDSEDDVTKAADDISLLAPSSPIATSPLSNRSNPLATASPRSAKRSQPRLRLDTDKSVISGGAPASPNTAAGFLANEEAARVPFLANDNEERDIDQPERYLSKSLDTHSILTNSSKKPRSRQLEHVLSDEFGETGNSINAPLLKTHQSLTALSHDKPPPYDKSNPDGVAFVNGKSNTGSGLYNRKPGGVRRLLSEESTGAKISLTRSMENIADGAVGSMMSLASLKSDIQVRF